jgi:hypothetical protein
METSSNSAGESGGRIVGGARQAWICGTRRANEQEIMAARRRDLERALGAVLALDVGKIERALGERLHLRLGP